MAKSRLHAAHVEKTGHFASATNFDILPSMEKAEIEGRLKALIVSSLDLEGVSPEEIETEAPLFGEGLGLDSIDALELGMAVNKEFGVAFSKDPAENKKVFHSVASLAQFVAAQSKEK